MTRPESKKGIGHSASGAHLERQPVSGGGALGVEGHYLLGDLLYVGDPDQGYLDLGDGIICARCASGEDHDIAGPVGTLAVLDADDVSRRIGFYGKVAAARDDHDALVGYRVDRAPPPQISPERGKDNSEADEKERDTE